MPNVIYENSRGVRYNLLEFSGCKLKEADFHQYSWGTTVAQKQFGEVVDKFTKEAKTFSAKICFRGSRDSRKTQIDNFHFSTEYDITHQKLGRIYWGTCYIEVYVIESDTYPGDNALETYNDVTFYAPYPFWIEEQKVEITPSQQNAQEGNKGYDDSYPYPYSYAYAPNVVGVDVDHYADSKFKLIAYGAFDSFNCNIAGNVYDVNYPVRTNQFLTIDSRQNTRADRKCFVTSETGIITNVFDYRNPDHQLFAPIPSGHILINYVRTYGIELTIYKERSEPR